MKLALVICPQWSDITPSFALGSLMSHIDNPNVKVKQFDLKTDYFNKNEDKESEQNIKNKNEKKK